MSAGYTRSARSHRRCRPIARRRSRSPRAASRISSIWVTFRSLVHPVDGHGTALVSGMSRDSSGPDSPSRSSTSRRNRSLRREPSRGLRAGGPDRHVREEAGAGRPSAGSSRRARTASDPARAPVAGRPAGTPTRAGSRPRGPRWARRPPSGRSAGTSAGRRPRAGRWVAAHRGAGRGSRSAAPRRCQVDGRPRSRGYKFEEARAFGPGLRSAGVIGLSCSRWCSRS